MRGTRKDTVPVTLPAVLGREVSGVVIGVGPRVTEFEVGDEVFGATATGFGGYAASTLLNVSSTAHKPPTVSWADAAVLTVAAGTAYDALHDLGLKPGATLLLLGRRRRRWSQHDRACTGAEYQRDRLSRASPREPRSTKREHVGLRRGTASQTTCPRCPQSEWTRFSTWSAGTLSLAALSSPDRTHRS